MMIVDAENDAAVLSYEFVDKGRKDFGGMDEFVRFSFQKSWHAKLTCSR